MRFAARLADMPIGQRIQPYSLALQMHVADPSAAIERARRAGLIRWLHGYVLESAVYVVANGVPPEQRRPN
jgi:hypothetical protein